MLEEHLRRAMIISHGDPSTFVTRPLSGALLALALFILVIVFMPAIAKKREQVF
jgi:TctA family transporter